MLLSLRLEDVIPFLVSGKFSPGVVIAVRQIRSKDFHTPSGEARSLCERQQGPVTSALDYSTRDLGFCSRLCSVIVGSVPWFPLEPCQVYFDCNLSGAGTCMSKAQHNGVLILI